MGANVLAGTVSQRIMDGARNMLEAEAGWRNPFGDGRAGESIVEHLTAV
jgi:UDP-N-acetylglucosamine 2-epimerase (non-hydrolysing)